MVLDPGQIDTQNIQNNSRRGAIVNRANDVATRAVTDRSEVGDLGPARSAPANIAPGPAPGYADALLGMCGAHPSNDDDL